MDSFRLVIEEIESRAKSTTDEKAKKVLKCLIPIFEDMNRRQISTEEVDDLLKRLKSLLMSDLNSKQLFKLKTALLQHLKQEHGLVTQNYYRNLWMVLGMSVFGMPIGLIFSLAIDNMAFIGTGLAIGMPIGMAIGGAKDKKALENGLVISGVVQSI